MGPRKDAMPVTQEQLTEARRFDAGLARDRGNGAAFKGGRLRRQMHLNTYYRLMEKCPPGTPAEERNKYLAENERIYLDHNEQRTPAGLRNRWGRVKERKVYG